MHDTTLIVSLSGEIDHHTSVEIRETVDREYQKRRAKNILFDFSNIVFMDSSGIGLLMDQAVIKKQLLQHVQKIH